MAVPEAYARPEDKVEKENDSAAGGGGAKSSSVMEDLHFVKVSLLVSTVSRLLHIKKRNKSKGKMQGREDALMK